MPTVAVVRPPLHTPKAELTWSDDGSTVTKRFVRLPPHPLLGTQAGAFCNEARVNRMLLTTCPPVTTPLLLASHRASRSLTFEAVDGEPLGPKFPTDLGRRDVEGLVSLATALDVHRPRRRWLRRLPVERRLRLHVAAGVLGPADADLVRGAAALDRSRWSFAHGDLTARNVLRRVDEELVLIDWEWAGLHPPLYDLAFAWFSLALAGEARAVVERAIPVRRRRTFLVSVVLIEALHLDMWARRGHEPTPFERRHAAQLRDDLRALRHLTGQAER